MECSRFNIGKNLAGSKDLDESRGITCLLIIGMILASENLVGAVEGLSNIGGELKNFVKVLPVSGVLLCDHRIPKITQHGTGDTEQDVPWHRHDSAMETALLIAIVLRWPSTFRPLLSSPSGGLTLTERAKRRPRWASAPPLT